MRAWIGKRRRLAILALLAVGGCEMIAKHAKVEVKSDEHSPFASSQGGPGRADDRDRMELEFRVPFPGGKKD